MAFPYSVQCIFCGSQVSSEFWEDVETHILACRETTDAWRRGDLTGWDGQTRLITCEESMGIAAMRTN